jgi:hypothetical protein
MEAKSLSLSACAVGIIHMLIKSRKKTISSRLLNRKLKTFLK